MSVDIFELPAPHPAEAERERAVEASGALRAADDPGLADLVEQARRHFRTPMAAVSIVYRDWQYLIAAAGLPGGPYSRRTSFCGHAITAADRLMCVSDTLDDARFAGNPSVTGGLLVRSYIGVKLLGEQQLPLGVLCVFDTKPNPCPAAGTDDMMLALADAVMARLALVRQRGAPPESAILAA